MQLSDDLCNYLESSYKFINSNILLSDLNTVLLDYTFDLKNYYTNKKLSKDILKVINEWKKEKMFNNNFIWLNENFYKIIEDDKIIYSGQLIFPIYHNNSLNGLLIFFRQRGKYILSSCKAPKTTRDFVEQMSDDNY